MGDFLLRIIPVFLALFSFFATATQPTIPPKSSMERKKIESLRFEKSASIADINDRLRANFSRDCLGYAYAGTDRDLLVSAVFESYPVHTLEAYLRAHPEQCPYTVREVLGVIERKSDKARAAGLASFYIEKYSGYETYPWLAHMWNIRPLLARLGCGEKDVKSFAQIYCGYSRQEDVSYLPKELEKRCPQAKVQCPQ